MPGLYVQIKSRERLTALTTHATAVSVEAKFLTSNKSVHRVEYESCHYRQNPTTPFFLVHFLFTLIYSPRHHRPPISPTPINVNPFNGNLNATPAAISNITPAAPNAIQCVPNRSYPQPPSHELIIAPI